MKHLIYLLAFGLFITMSCDKIEPTPSLAGDWDVEAVYTDMTTSDELRYDPVLMTFNEDGTGSSPVKQPVVFEWQKDGNVLNITSDLFDAEHQRIGVELLNDDLTQVYNILELTENSCILERVYQVMFFPPYPQEPRPFKETMYMER